MRLIPITSSLFLLLTLAHSSPNNLSPFFPPQLLLDPQQTADNSTLFPDSDLSLLKRANSGCANGYNVCNGVGASGLCCKIDTVCSADSAGNIGCCPFRAACTGTLAGNNNNGATSTGTGTARATTTGGGGIVFPSTTSPSPTSTGTGGGSFIQSGGPTATTTTASRSYVPNTLYPFPFIATTYPNARACSSAYSTCQSDAASCSSALASGVQGVTISAPNGGATVTAIASLGPQAASSVCASLSQEACYGLTVEACQAFGTGTAGGGGGSGSGSAGKRNMGCGGLYGVGAGVAVGIAGQMLR